jgi:pSer/pThr/pTyr-binding forkhead associated (FHA) protein
MAFCDNCGASLAQAGPQPAEDPWQQAAERWPEPPAPEVAAADERAAPAEPALQPRLVIQGANATIAFPPDQSEVIIGREDAVSNHFPDIDLAPHGGEAGGVSRRHARVTIRDGQCFIEDLDSVNYTIVNKQKLQPHNSQLLQDGDELRFGRVVATFHTH